MTRSKPDHVAISRHTVTLTAAAPNAIEETRPSMSYQDDTKALVAELLERDTQGWARLLGLMSQLALPSRPTIEVEVAPDQWTVIDALAIERADGALVLILSCGVGASRQVFQFAGTEPIPAWRHGPRAAMIPTAERRR